MQDFHALETSVLLDMLVTHSASYTRMSRHGASEEDFARCRLMLWAIQAEMKSRQRTKNTLPPLIPAAPDHSPKTRY